MYGTEATTEQRRSDTRSYVKCLEDVVFGIVFGASIATGKVADVIPGVNPFKDLKIDLSLSVYEADAHGKSEADLLKDSNEIYILRDLIVGLDGAIRRDPDAWGSLARREFAGSLNDSALKEDLDDPSEYKFAGRADFWPNRELQELVPDGFRDKILSHVRGTLDLPVGVCDKALKAFLSRMVLAHLLIFRTYQRAFSQRYINTAAIHIPYATRASLPPMVSNTMWTIRDHVVPRIILRILDGPKTREDFRNVLGQNSVNRVYKKHRELFAEALTYQAEGRTSEADNVVAALQSLSLGDPTDTVRIGNLTGHTLNSVPIAIRRESIDGEYESKLQKVFPELHFGSESSQRPTVTVGPATHRTPDSTRMQKAVPLAEMDQTLKPSEDPSVPHLASKSMGLKRGEVIRTAFDVYTVERQVGAGGSGVVYEVVNTEAARFAVKVLDISRAGGARVKRFKNEMNFCLRNHHRNIIRVLGTGLTDADAVFYVMPFYPRTLRDLMGGIKPADVLPLYGQILDGVEAAHLQGIWHRDLKPENILYSPDDHALVVADFGIAHFEEEELLTAVETKPGERLANFLYAAPEQRSRGRTVDQKADVYALGLMLHEMFSDEVPLGTGHGKVADAAPEFAHLDPLIELMRNQEPARRPSIGEVKQELIARGHQFIERQR
jgi:hypothetical protein